MSCGRALTCYFFWVFYALFLYTSSCHLLLAPGNTEVSPALDVKTDGYLSVFYE